MTYESLTTHHVPSQVSEPAAEQAVATILVRKVRLRQSEQLRIEEAGNGGPIDRRRRDEIAETFLAEELEAYAHAELAAGRPMPDAATERAWAKEARDHLFGLGGLQPYLDMADDVENINIHGHDQVFLRLTGNRRVRGEWPVARSDKELIELVREIASRSGEEERQFSRKSPLLDLQLPDGSRLNASGWVVDRPSLSIRIHRITRATMAMMVEDLGVMDSDLAAFLTAAVKARLNILLSGGPNTGKTTLLRALASEIPPWEVLVTIEDSRELNLGADSERAVYSFQAREANIEGEGAISLADLARNALRMAPDRVIIGEVRGEEILPMFAAMSQGSDGSMATIHASSSRQAFMKIASYAAKGPEGLRLEEANLYAASAIDLIVQLDYADDLTTRVVASVREILDADGPQLITNEVYRPDETGRAEPTGALSAARAKRLEAAGLDPRILAARTRW